MGNWFHGGVRFECTACGKCCTAAGNHVGSEGAAYVTDEEAFAIAGRFKMSREEFLKRCTFVTPLGRRALRLVYIDAPQHLVDGMTPEQVFDRAIAETGSQEVAEARMHEAIIRSWQGSGYTACLFWNPTTKLCDVHEVRPGQCRTYPFWPENVQSEYTWESTGKRCEGIGRGELIQEADLLTRIKPRHAQTG